MKEILTILTCLLIGGACASALAQSTRPAEEKTDAASLETRANAHFERKEYSKALPLYMILVNQLKDPRRIEAVQERIKVCQAQMLKTATPADLQDLAGQRPADETSPEKRKKHVRPKDGEAYDLPVKSLGNFEFDPEKGGGIPDDVKALSGVKVRTRGFMIPLDQADNITEFALVPSLFACCFGQPPQVQHTMIVKTPKGKAVSYFPEEIVIEGKLTVEEKKDEGIIISIFEVECTSVKPAGN